MKEAPHELVFEDAVILLTLGRAQSSGEHSSSSESMERVGLPLSQRSTRLEMVIKPWMCVK